MSQYQHIARAIVPHAYALRCLLNMIDDQHLIITWGSQEVKLCHLVKENDSTSILNIIIATGSSYSPPTTPVSVKVSRTEVIKYISVAKANKVCTIYLAQDVVMQYALQFIIQDHTNPSNTFVIAEAALPSHVVFRQTELVGYIPSKQLIGMADLCKVQNAKFEVNVMTDPTWQCPAVQLSVYHETTQVSSVVIRPPGSNYVQAPRYLYSGLCMAKLSHLKSSFKNDIGVLLVYNQPTQNVDLSHLPDLKQYQYRIVDATQLTSTTPAYHVVFQGTADFMSFQLILI